MFAVNIIYQIIIAEAAGLIVLLLFRKDLIRSSLTNGLVFMIMAITGLFIFVQIYPGIIQKWWLLDKISGILIIGIPLEEYMWHFITGATIGPIYEILKSKGYYKK
jgi:hypothetical protein